MSSARKTKRKLKLKLKLTAPKPRNPLVALAAQRKAGSHRKSQSAIRRAEKMALEKQLPDQ
ncbi:MAG: hypothetical protein Q8K05_11665 [Polaromonas sp.]|jgi:hypothetical protein|uniref:hypothetical protein n=1 Tax=Polaromonas sp. TaxID=1869339 RepID=UPI002730E9CF|nr:hypothetical protein [Polaromonas sp.]MDP2256696.1 hypothetical protein [Polaromonas sp.]MDP3708645.1 hypothetical protein [Polaromonas sp.]